MYIIYTEVYFKSWHILVWIGRLGSLGQNTILFYILYINIIMFLYILNNDDTTVITDTITKEQSIWCWFDVTLCIIQKNIVKKINNINMKW